MTVLAVPYEAQIHIPPPQATERIRLGLASPTATFNVNYNGFPDAAKNAFQAAVDIWASLLVSPVPIRLDVDWAALPGLLLGNAGPAKYVINEPKMPGGFWFPIALANKLAGQDLLPGNPHIVGKFNSSTNNWYFGTDGKTPAGQFDFVTIVLHEICHGLGFANSFEVSTNNIGHFIGSWEPNANPRVPGWTDLFLRFGQSDPSSIYLTALQNDSDDLYQKLTSSNIYHESIEGTAANGGQWPKLYAPSLWEQGTSVTHLDPAIFPPGNINSLMTPSKGTGESIHTPGPVMLGILHSYQWSHTTNLRSLRLPQNRYTKNP